MLLLIYLGTRGVSSKGSLLFVLLATFFWTTIALAQDYRGMSDQRMSCTPDAFRWCAATFPMPLRLKTASGIMCQTSAPRADQFSTKRFAQR